MNQLEKICLICGELFSKPENRSLKSWLMAKSCSKRCANINLSNILSGRPKSPFTEEHKEKLRIGRLGKKASPETKEKLSAGMRQRYIDDSTLRDKISQQMKGHTYNAGREPWNKGKEFLAVKGDKNVNWRGGVSKINKTERQLAMETLEYKKWRSDVFKRDNYSCVNCSIRGGRLNADHIKPWRDFPDLRYSVENGRTLCVPCHKELGWNLFKNDNPRQNSNNLVQT